MATLDALYQVSIEFDSSLNAAYIRKGAAQGITASALSAPCRLASVWEFPVTVFETGWGLKPLHVNAISTRELVSVLWQAARSGLGTATVVLHSFDLMRIADAQYRKLSPNRLVIQRFRELCRFLASHRDTFEVVTFSESIKPTGEAPPPRFPRVGPFVSATRKLVQALDHFHWA